MKVSHELPLSLLHYSYEWNDYDYCLPHLMDKYEQYKLFFQKAKQDERFIIMDNGLFEGVTHTTKDLLSKIELLQPNIFIVPDAWNDSSTTLRNAKNWMTNYKSSLPEGVELMAVLQGKTFGELIVTYQTLVDLGYKHIAFNHSSEAYQTIDDDVSPLKKQMMGRFYIINKLIDLKVMMHSYYHHLLGCSLPQEKRLYNQPAHNHYNCLKSIDTSNPVILGALGHKYEKDGVEWKPKEKIEEFFEVDLRGQLKNITFNVEKFKNL